MEAESSKIEGKMSGYLEKKGKMKVMSSYKRYWFVLEGRLLLYYRSKDEYEAISPCKGSVTLGPPCTVKPCTSHCGVFQISTRSTTITLRAENMEDQNKWMQAIMVALKQNCSIPQKLSHFRYSLDELTTTDSVDKKPLARQNTMPERMSPKKNKKIIERLQKIGAQTYGGSVGQLPRLVRRSGKTEGRSMSEESLTSNVKKIDKAGICCSAESINNSNNTLDHFYERISSNESLIVHREKSENSCINKSKEGALLFGNDSYCDLDRITIVRRSQKFKKVDSEKETVDINENIDKSYHVSQSSSSHQSQENAYSVTALFGSENSLSKRNDHEYEDVDKFKGMRKYSSTNSDSSHTQDLPKSCAFKNFTRKLRHKDSIMKNDDNTKNEKLKKSASFLKRVWKRTKKKPKDPKTSSEDEGIYESVPELNQADKKQNVCRNQPEVKNDTIKKAVISIKNNEENLLNKHLQKKTDEQLIVKHAAVKKTDTEEIEETCPELPPKKQKPHAFSPHHDVPANTQPVPPPKKKKQANIDEILRDLDQQKATQTNSESPHEENKVKQLIKKFSEPESSDGEVVIRNKKPLPYKYEEIDSNELNKLLDELAKVTNAPIMTPGVTSSLISPNLVDNELSKFLPARQRRYSEPDYDIPRPHRSLVNIQKKDENALEATRFFGPILKPSDMQVKIESPLSEDPSSVWLSMTPDSLEVDISPKTVDSNEEKIRSYNSHEYAIDTISHGSTSKFDKSSHKNLPQKRLNIQEAVIYAHPKQLLSIVTKAQAGQHNFYNKSVKNMETMAEDNESIFVDSLEICGTELKSTVF